MRDEPLVMTATPGGHADITVITLTGPLTLQNMFAFQHDIRQYTPPIMIIDLSGTPYWIPPAWAHCCSKTNQPSLSQREA